MDVGRWILAALLSLSAGCAACEPTEGIPPEPTEPADENPTGEPGAQPDGTDETPNDQTGDEPEDSVENSGESIDWCAPYSPPAEPCARIDSPRGCEWSSPDDLALEIVALSIPTDSCDDDVANWPFMANCAFPSLEEATLGRRQHFVWLGNDITISYSRPEPANTPMEQVVDEIAWGPDEFGRTGPETGEGGSYRLVLRSLGYPLPVTLRDAAIEIDLGSDGATGTISGLIDPRELWHTQRALVETCKSDLEIREKETCAGFEIVYRNGYDQQTPAECEGIEAVDGLGLFSVLPDVDTDGDDIADHVSAAVNFEAIRVPDSGM